MAALGEPVGAATDLGVDSGEGRPRAAKGGRKPAPLLRGTLTGTGRIGVVTAAGRRMAELGNAGGGIASGLAGAVGGSRSACETAS